MAEIVLDLETTGLDWTKDKIILLGYKLLGRDKQLVQFDGPELDSDLGTVLAMGDSTLIGHNIKFDAHFLRRAGYDIRCKLLDTRVLAYTEWPELESHGLKELVQAKLGRVPTKLEDIEFKPLKREQGHFSAYTDFYYEMGEGKYVRKDLLREYHADDINNCESVYNLLTPSDWFTEVEMPLTRMIYEMEAYGCPLDLKHLEKIKEEFERKMGVLRLKLGASEEFNPASNDQVSAKLQELGHNLEEIAEKTKTGKYSVNADLLKKLSHKGDAFCAALLEYRRFAKLTSTYVDPFIQGAKFDGRLHGSFNQAGSEDVYGDSARGTRTGRLSSSDPNLQNVSARTKEGKEVRKAFIAPEGEFMFDADLKQIEPRLVGHYSQSPKLINAYNNGLDTHGMFASDIFSKPVNSLSAIERFIGKTSWLATVYGCSFKKLLLICERYSEGPLALPLEARHYSAWGWLPIKRRDNLIRKYGKEAEALYPSWMFFKEVQDNFKKANPEIMGWRDAHIERTRRLGYVVTLGGRIIRISGLDSSDEMQRLFAERATVNYQIQPSAADVMKLIMLQYQDKYVSTGKGRCFAVVHDEILGSLRNKEDGPGVKALMENTVKLRNVPIEADFKFVNNWSDK
jgi:DNA polymerase-1